MIYVTVGVKTIFRMLQKYRLSKNLQAQANVSTSKNAIGCATIADRMPGTSAPTMSSTNYIPQAEK